MSKKKNRASKVRTPATPTPTSEQYFQDGNLQSERIYDPKTKMYRTESFSDPTEKAIQDSSSQFISGLMGQLPDKFNMSDEQKQGYVDAYTEPQKRALNESYDKALTSANTNAMAGGMRNSVGFNNFLANELEKNKAQGLADIEGQGKLMGNDLVNQELSPFMNAFNLANSALTGQQANTMQTLNPAFQGSQASNSFNLSNYQNQMANYNAQMQQNQQGKRGGNFFGWLTGRSSLY